MSPVWAHLSFYLGNTNLKREAIGLANVYQIRQ